MTHESRKRGGGTHVQALTFAAQEPGQRAGEALHPWESERSHSLFDLWGGGISTQAVIGLDSRAWRPQAASHSSCNLPLEGLLNR